MPSALEQELAWQVRAAKLPEPVCEHRFAPPRRWRFDLAWVPHRFAVEIDGGGYVHGRHSRGAGIEKDCEKGAAALLAGWRVLRVTGKHVQSGEALQWIEQALGG